MGSKSSKAKRSEVKKECKKIIEEAKAIVPPPVDNEEDLEISAGQFVIETGESIYTKYSLKGKIGAGAFSSVYRAQHRISGEIRAVKVVDKSRLNPEILKKIIEEFKIMKELDHPNILKLYEVFSDAKYYYMVMELVEGGELFDYIKTKGISAFTTTAGIMRQLLSAIKYCHQKGIVHRDIKPENILLDSSKKGDLNIKVIDFGTAGWFKPESRMHQVMGTPLYLAPEVLERSYDEKCDVWSCGVIMFILLSGVPPFYGRTDEEILASVKSSKYSFSSSIWKVVPESAKNLVQKMLIRNPKERISAEEAFVHPFIQKQVTTELDKDLGSLYLNNLRSFHVQQKLQQASLMYIVTQLVDRKENEELKQTFLALDKNSDGVLSKEELIEGYTKIFGDPERARVEVAQIMENADADHSGSIDYSEFLLACTNKRKILSRDNLKKAFDFFDKDKSGSVSAEEIKAILGIGKRVSEKVWLKILEEVDENKDGEISFEEFENMMNKFLT